MKNETLAVLRIALLGDEKAFGQLVGFYQAPIRRFFFNMTNGDEEVSKDLAQETFIKAWLNIRTFQAASKFSTWLYRIAYNTFYDHIRAKKPTESLDAKTMGNHPIAASHNKDFDIDFLQALKVLNEDERSIMLLFYMEDQTIDTISKIMNCPSGTVKSYLSRGKKKLAVFFKNSEYDK